MISDIKTLAGIESYLQSADGINLGILTAFRDGAKSSASTKSLSKNQQLTIAGIQLLIEHEDLNTLMNLQLADNNKPSPLFHISVMKEMFPGLFADPFSHRVHNIAGFLDFNDGELRNGKVMEIDGIPTILSTGSEECTWVSKEYKFPDPIEINAIAWELATSKLTPPDSFHYHISLIPRDSSGNLLPEIEMGTASGMLKANARRAQKHLNQSGIASFHISFTAKVFEDSYFKESHLPTTFNENIGRPLLRAINILEPIQSAYNIYSITELKSICSDFHLFETPGPEIKRLTATIDINAVLVHSPNQALYDDEHIELIVLHDSFTNFEAKILGFESVNVDA